MTRPVTQNAAGQRGRWGRLFKPGGLEALNDITPEVIAEICRVHITTARRWKRGEEPPFTALQLLKLFNDRELGVVDLKWAHWRMKEGLLVSPDGQTFTPGDVMSIAWLRMQIQSYQRDQRFILQSDWIDQKWRPATEQEEIRASA
ncbi:MAG: DUF3653 domain-containing protein [Woeseia sp.]